MAKPVGDDSPEAGNGGFGGSLFTYDKTHAADLKLARRAVRNGWNPSAEVKKKIMDRMEVIIDCETDDELAIKAAKVVIDADKADIAAERNVVEQNKPTGNSSVTINYNRLTLAELIKLEELGVKAGIVDASNEAEPGGDSDSAG